MRRPRRRRNGVAADARMYAGLMSVAGAAGDVDLAFSLLDEMEGEDLRQCTVRRAARFPARAAGGCLARTPARQPQLPASLAPSATCGTCHLPEGAWTGASGLAVV